MLSGLLNKGISGVDIVTVLEGGGGMCICIGRWGYGGVVGGRQHGAGEDESVAVTLF